MDIDESGSLIFEKNALAVDEFSVNEEGQLISSTDPSITYEMVDEELIRTGDEVIAI